MIPQGKYAFFFEKRLANRRFASSLLVGFLPNDGGPVLYCYRPLLKNYGIWETIRSSNISSDVKLNVNTVDLRNWVRYVADPFHVVSDLETEEKMGLLRTAQLAGISDEKGEMDGIAPLSDLIFESFEKFDVEWKDFNEYAKTRGLDLYNVRHAQAVLLHFRKVFTAKGKEEEDE